MLGKIAFLLLGQLGLEMSRANMLSQSRRPRLDLLALLPWPIENRAAECQFAPGVPCWIVGPGAGVAALRQDVAAAEEQDLPVDGIVTQGPPEQRRPVLAPGWACGRRQIHPCPRSGVVAERVAAR